ncbi:hypothetical protein CFK37_06970 [Virgibacillus phasianinus]|uniref:DUF2878 domain-containing protein n=1 Tax=Virgibacillus phasianinus TaxID=2017483 RepID=A0A220U1A1_9BACI|nr:CBO0543 family protein [Virgibacillus phasianinus]ASK61918.1 hypothetical protein CFK37_06970 [Virgibacillus phasianinus]
MKEEKIDQVGGLYEKFHQLHEEFGNLWQDETLLHWDWWIALLVSAGAWVLWIRYRKRDSTHRLLYAGLFSIIVSVCMDYIGVALGLWYYTGKPLPTFPAWAPFHFCMLPVAIMFFIQIKPHISPWIKGLLFGLITSFLAEPILVWTGYYVLTGWQYIYSVPIYVIIYVICDYLANRVTFEKIR